jgi:hypothetical protein
LTLAHTIDVPAHWRGGSEQPWQPDVGPIHRYIDAYDRGWWTGVERYMKNMDFDDPSPLVMSGWPEEAAGGADGYYHARERVEQLIRVFGKRRVFEYLQQFKLADQR